MIWKYERFITETLESPAIIKWSVSQDRMKGKFKIGLEDYAIISKLNKGCEDINSWNYKFYWNDGGDIIYSLTGMGKNKFRVMATVVEGFRNLIKTKNPDSIIFHANIDEDSRVKFYNSLMEKAVSEYGFRLHKFPFSSGEKKLLAYILYRNPEDLERLKKSAKEIPTKWEAIKDRLK